MRPGISLFSYAHAVTVYKDTGAELYKLAKEALVRGDSTFIYQGRLWRVDHDGHVGSSFVIMPEVRTDGAL